MRSLRVVVGSLCLAALVLAPSALSTQAAAKKCAVAKAGGHTYAVSATAVTCSFADKWVSALAGKHLKAGSHNVRLSGGPAGFVCQAGTKQPSDSMPAIKPDVQIAGNCAKGLGAFGGSPYFNWVVVTKR